jgi:hypothetical protein
VVGAEGSVNLAVESSKSKRWVEMVMLVQLPESEIAVVYRPVLVVLCKRHASCQSLSVRTS